MKKTLLAILLATAGIAHAEFISGNRLLELMRGSTTDAAIAIGYVVGAADAYTGSVTCPPDNVSAGQVRDIIRKFLEANPEHRNNSADVIIGAVLQRAWPCKNKTSAPAGSKLI